jgi:hypothetical protein
VIAVAILRGLASRMRPCAHVCDCTCATRRSRNNVSAFLFSALFVLAQFVWASTPVFAETINVKSAVIRPADEAYVVDAEFDFSLTAPLEEVLLRGTPLYFVLESEITRSRSFWFDESVATTPSIRRLTYVPLTGSYRVDAGGAVSRSTVFGSGPFGGVTFTTLDEALRQIRVVRSRTLVEKKELRSGSRYDVSLRLRLDTTQLPKPLQVNTLVSREWSLVSDWYRVVVTTP